MDRMRILITGASGNVGRTLCRALTGENRRHFLIAAGRGGRKDAQDPPLGVDEFRRLDFGDPAGFETALEGIDLVFLLRPPQVTRVKETFSPFFEAMKKNEVKKIIFLSVQGAEKQSYIPHAKIEKLILEFGFEYVFLRPGYFMQNLSTTLFEEIRERGRIYMPAGRLRFNWVDTADIGEMGAVILNSFDNHIGKAYEITSHDFKDFEEVVRMINRHSPRKIRYVSPPVLSFFRYKRLKGLSVPMILVLLMLHTLPRWGKNPDRQSGDFQILTGKEPSSLENFIKRELIPIIP